MIGNVHILVSLLVLLVYLGSSASLLDNSTHLLLQVLLHTLNLVPHTYHVNYVI